MQDLPHLYRVSASAEGAANVTLSAKGLPDLETAGPPEYGGPGDVWSPETLLVGAVADCFILSFRGIARSARLEWLTLDCEAEGDLDKIEKFTQFTGFRVKAKLTIPADGNEKKAHVILEKAEKYCLISNSMKAGTELEAEVVVVDS
ncbi:MAG: OsmC family protein [Gammaproteobacteria bacterium]